MNSYEKLAYSIKECCADPTFSKIQLGVVADNKRIKIKDITLESDDYIINSNLSFSAEPIFFHATQNKESSLIPYEKNLLKNGDIVLIVPLQGDLIEKFAVIGKMVSV